METITHLEWEQKGRELFGDDKLTWKFVCPVCEHVASVGDYKEAGAPQGAVGFSCIGRYLETRKEMGEKPGPCNYAGGGLFQLNPVTVTFPDDSTLKVFKFASND